MRLRLPKMLILSPEQLTGRVRTHVIELLEPRCTLHREAAAAFLALRAAAARFDIDLMPASSFRNFDRQLMIWNDKFYGRRPLLDAAEMPLDRAGMSEAALVQAILIWSALPGASRHHWGTEIDVIDAAALTPGQTPQLIQREYAPGGLFERLGAWLPQHCAQYGFFLPYDLYRGGVQPEPWHLSYAPVSSHALAGLTVEVLEAALGEIDLGGAAVVTAQLKAIHTQYVVTIGQPGAAALTDGRVNPATRPS
jgi:LAS superfamily LD-carboxypeptidase LdcB